MSPFRSTVSVVIPAYNAAQTLAETIASVLRQTITPLEILVIDDASTDGTAALAILQHPLVRLVSAPVNGGGSTARNLGILHAQGDFIAFLDADDRWAPDKLERQLQQLEDDPDAGRVSVTNFRIVGGQGRGRLSNRRAMQDGETVTHYLFGSEGNRLQCSSFLVPRAACLSHPFRQHTAPHDDWDFLLTLQRAGYRILYLHDMLVDYHDHSLHARVSKQRSTAASLAWIAALSPSLPPAERAGLVVNTLYSRGYYRTRPFYMIGQLLLARRHGVITTGRLLTNGFRILAGDRAVARIDAWFRAWTVVWTGVWTRARRGFLNRLRRRI